MPTQDVSARIDWALLRARAVDLRPSGTRAIFRRAGSAIDWEKVAICFVALPMAGILPAWLFPENAAGPMLPLLSLVSMSLWCLLVGFRKET